MSKRAASPAPLPRAARTQPPPAASLGALHADGVASIARFLELPDVARLLCASRGLLAALSKPCGLCFEYTVDAQFAARGAAARHVTQLNAFAQARGGDTVQLAIILARVARDMPWVTHLTIDAPADMQAWPAALTELTLLGGADETSRALLSIHSAPRLRQLTLDGIEGVHVAWNTIDACKQLQAFSVAHEHVYNVHLHVQPLLRATTLREVVLGGVLPACQEALVAAGELPWTKFHFCEEEGASLVLTGEAVSRLLPRVTDLHAPVACVLQLSLRTCARLTHLHANALWSMAGVSQLPRVFATCTALVHLHVHTCELIALDLSACALPRLEQLVCAQAFPTDLRLVCPRLRRLELYNTAAPLTLLTLQNLLALRTLTEVRFGHAWNRDLHATDMAVLLPPLRACHMPHLRLLDCYPALRD